MYFWDTLIKKILKVDYPRGRAKEYYANFISAKAETQIFFIYPSVRQRSDISPEFRGEK